MRRIARLGPGNSVPALTTVLSLVGLALLALSCGSVRQLTNDHQVLPQGALQVTTDNSLRRGSTVKLSAVFQPGYLADASQFHYLWTFSGPTGAAPFVSPLQSDAAEPEVTLYSAGQLTVSLELSTVYQGKAEHAAYAQVLTVLDAAEDDVDPLPPAGEQAAVSISGDLVSGGTATFALQALSPLDLPGVQYLWDFKTHANPPSSAEPAPSVVLTPVSGATPVTDCTVTLTTVHGGAVESRTYPFYFAVTVPGDPLPADGASIPVNISGSRLGGGTGLFSVAAGVIPASLPVQYLWDFAGHSNPSTSTEASPGVQFGLVDGPTTVSDCTLQLAATVNGAPVTRTYHFSFALTDPGDPLPVDGTNIALTLSGNFVGGQTGTFAVASGAIPDATNVQYLWDFKGHAAPSTSTAATASVKFAAVNGPQVYDDCKLTLIALHNGEYETRVYPFVFVVTNNT